MFPVKKFENIEICEGGMSSEQLCERGNCSAAAREASANSDDVNEAH